MAAKTHTSRLEQLRLTEVAERARAREMDLAANAAKADADQRRSMLVEAHASGDGRAVTAAQKRRAKADDHAEDASIMAEAAEVRAERAAKTTQAFEAEHARALLSELEPAGDEVATRLEGSARELVAANGEWLAIAQRVGELLVAMPNATPVADAPATHLLEAVVRDVRRALEQGDVASPLPHYRGVQHHEAERERAEELRQRREEVS